MSTQPTMRPQMKCCDKPDIRWIARDGSRRLIRAYRCENCYATDRPVSAAEQSFHFRKRVRNPLRPQTAQIAELVEKYRRETRGFSRRQLVARAKVYLSAKRGKLVA